MRLKGLLVPRPVTAKPRKTYIAAFALTASLVAFWGLGHRLYDTLMPLLADAFHLQGMRLGLTQSIYNFVYLFTALPAALYARCFGYKAAILLGLGLVAVGAFTLYPASETLAFPFFVIATLFMAQGWLVLEIAANPFFMAFGSQDRAVFRLNLAQCLYPIGAIAGVCAGHWLADKNLALPSAGYSYSFAHPYILIGACVLVLAFLVEETDYPESAKERIPGLRGIMDEIKTLLANPLIRFGMLAQFCGIVAVGAMWTSMLSALRAIPALLSVDGKDIFLLCTVLFAIGRLIGTALMIKMSPAKVLVLFAGSGSAMAVLGGLCGAIPAAMSLLGLNLALSVTWPTILGLAIQGLGQKMKIATALLALAGAIGAIVYHLAGTVFGAFATAQLGLVAVCCAVVTAFALFALEKEVLGRPPAGSCFAKKAN